MIEIVVNYYNQIIQKDKRFLTKDFFTTVKNPSIRKLNSPMSIIKRNITSDRHPSNVWVSEFYDD